MKLTKNIEYYPVKIQINGQKLYCIWYSLEEEDRLISKNDQLLVFSSMNKVVNFSKYRGLKLNLDYETAFYNLDIPFEENNSSSLLGFWNIFSDIANSINVSFRGDIQGAIRDQVYDKLCDEVIWKQSKAYFSDEEWSLLHELWNEGKEMVHQELKKVAPTKKKEKILALVKEHQEHQLFARITRLVDKKYGIEKVSRGYIVLHSEDFVLLKEEDDFIFHGYNIIPMKTIRKIRYNKSDQFYDFITKSEYPESAFRLNDDLKIDLSSWETIFESLQRADKVIISECERDKHQYFAIGKLAKIDEKAIFINYFDAQGKLDEEPVEHKFKWITKITFDDNYSKVFSKYIRE
jgi:hypothetical protein